MGVRAAASTTFKLYFEFSFLKGYELNLMCCHNTAPIEKA